MIGFIGILRKNAAPDLTSTVKTNKNRTVIPFGSGILELEIHTNNKFLSDKFLSVTGKRVIAADGVMINARRLRIEYGMPDNASLIDYGFRSDYKSFLAGISGEFSGCYADRESNTIFLYTNHTAARLVFYFNNETFFAFSSNVTVLRNRLAKLGVSLSPSSISAYNMLSFGFMPGNSTLFNEIKTINAGSLLQFSNNALSETAYFHFTDSDKLKVPEKEIIQLLDERFCYAVKEAFEKDEEDNRTHLATISGGLDSRNVVYTAMRLGYKPETFTFCEKGYADETISRKFAKRHNLPFSFIPLTKGEYLTDIENNIHANDGMVYYSGAAHLRRALMEFAPESYGLLHTGMLGDAMLGSYLSGRSNTGSIEHLKRLNGFFTAKTDAYEKKLMEDFTSGQLYKLYYRGFRAMLNGHRVAASFADSVSPFLHKDFLSLCLAIPDSMKYKRKIYLHWLFDKYPEIKKNRWEYTLLPAFFPQDFRYLTKGSIYVFNKLFRRFEKGINMNPYNYWYDNNNNLRAALDNYYNMTKDTLSFDAELAADAGLQFRQGGFIDKAAVVTLSGALVL